MPYSQEQIDTNIEACDHMYLGEGWYKDGHEVNRIDYYNAWAFHYNYLIWTILDGESKPELAAKFKDRMRAFSRNFPYFFSADGSTPCWGRSMIYRFGYLAPFALGKYLNCLDVSLEQLKTMYDMTLQFYFSHPIITDDDYLSMGFLRTSEGILEHYNCGGSPYWAVKAMNIFMLPPTDPFWSAEEGDLPIHKSDFSVPVKAAGLLVTGNKRTGQVQLINHNSYHDKDEYNAKYTNFAYSSVFSFDARTVYGSFNCDNAFSFSEDGINFFQRWKNENLFCEKDFAASIYPLYDKVDKNGKVAADFYRETGEIITYTIVKDDFMINLHRVQTDKTDLVFKEGGYPLGFDDGWAQTVSGKNSEAAYINGKFTYIRNLYGWQQQHKAAPFHDQVNGINVRYYKSLVPSLSASNKDNKVSYFASMIYAKPGNESINQLDNLVENFSLDKGKVKIVFYDGEEVFIQIGDIREEKITLNDRQYKGNIVIARNGGPAGEMLLKK